MLELAILDDYQNCALQMADWGPIRKLANITVFNRPLGPVEAAQKALAPFDIVCTMRERTGFPRALIEQLPRLKLLTITGARVPNFDLDAANERGIVISHTTAENRPASVTYATAEFAWGLLLAVIRNIVPEEASMRRGGWQTTVGESLAGKTLGLLGLGRLGGKLATYGRVFDMDVIAWSQNLTAEKAEAAGAKLVGKEELFERSDAVSIHLVLSDRSRGLVAAADLARMKRGAILINTSRGPIVDQPALLAALNSGAIRAGIDVYDQEPLPADHPLRQAPNTVLSPHLGYVTRETYSEFFADTIANILAWHGGTPLRVYNPASLAHMRRP